MTTAEMRGVAEPTQHVCKTLIGGPGDGVSVPVLGDACVAFYNERESKEVELYAEKRFGSHTTGILRVYVWSGLTEPEWARLVWAKMMEAFEPYAVQR
jgi:hypothetical protein